MKSSFFVLLPLLISAVCNWRSVGADSSPTGASTIGSAAPPPSAPAPRSAAELEKLAQPIALHPDPLIAIILPAAVYPLEIVQAARFIKDTNNIPKVDEQPWDNNVKQLAKYPEMIARMDADLSWTIDLGQAFLDQPKELMDTIQGLRSKAQKAGTLRTTPQQIVTVTNIVVIQTNVTQVTSVTREIVQVQPANPEIIYVPSYPTTVYYPPPYYVYNPYAPLVTFGLGMAWGAVLANNCNWGYGHVDVDVDIDRNTNINRDRDRVSQRSGDRGAGNRGTGAGNQKPWKPDQNRMRTSGASPTTREARGWGSGTGQGGAANVGTRPSTGGVGARPSTGNLGARPSTGVGGSGQSAWGSGNRPTTGAGGSRPTTGTAPSSRPSVSSGQNRPSTSAFSGVNNGSAARNSSNRGATSRSAGGYGGGASRGGGGMRGGGGGSRGGGGRGR